MSKDKLLQPIVDERVSVEDAHELVKLGQWYWYKTGQNRVKEDMPSSDLGWRLMCVTHIGSNYIELETPSFNGVMCVARIGSKDTNGHGWRFRVHIDDFWSSLRHEPRANELIHKNIERLQQRVSGLLAHINRTANQIGVNPANARIQQSSSGKGLAVMSGSNDIDLYKRKVIHFKKILLPKLTQRLKKENEVLAGWLSAEGIALSASVSGLSTMKETVDERVFNISIYAALSELITTVLDGEPAAIDERIHLFQRMAYMDEESLLDYRAGGMEFADIGAFNSWMAKPENLERLLPFPRCVLAFRVRRNKKDRHEMNIYDQIRLGISDKYTFLYVRNGERLSVVKLDNFEFGEKLFPDIDQFDPSEPMVAKIFANKVISVITRRKYDALLEQRDRDRDRNQAHYNAMRVQWFIENPFEEWAKTQSEDNRTKEQWRHSCKPFYFSDRHDLDEYEPFDRSSVYFDDIRDYLQSKTTHFNRMALILQGLIDRSEVFSPHQSIQAWNPTDFNEHFKLIYLAAEEYHQRLNGSNIQDLKQ